MFASMKLPPESNIDHLYHPRKFPCAFPIFSTLAPMTYPIDITI